MPRKFPFLESLTKEIDQLGFEIEDEARGIVQRDIADVRKYKTQVFDGVREIVEDHRKAVGEMKDKLEQVLDQITTNSGDRKNG